MASISKAQGSLGSNFSIGGISKPGEAKLDNAESVLLQAANEFRRLALERIEQRKKVDTGNLSDIQVSVTVTGSKYEIGVGYEETNPASKYYDFQNKGVKGVTSGQPSNSPYSYKNTSVSLSMISSIMQWYLRHKNYITNEDQTKNLSGTQKKRKSLGTVANEQTKLKQIATATAISIKKRGIPRLGFFDDNLDKAFGEEFKTKLAQALGKDITVSITQNFNP